MQWSRHREPGSSCPSRKRVAGKDIEPAYPDNGFDVADDLDQATGLQHAELVADLQGKPFFQESLISGPFGTVDNPTLIESTLGYRIVGCTGAPPPRQPPPPPPPLLLLLRARA